MADWASFAGAAATKKTSMLGQLSGQLQDVQAKVAAADPKAKDAAQKFEAFYIQQFLEMSMPSPDTDSMFYGGMGEEMFRHQLYEKVADGVAAQGGFGLADKIVAQMVLRQEAESRVAMEANSPVTTQVTPAGAAAAYAASAQ